MRYMYLCDSNRNTVPNGWEFIVNGNVSVI